MMTRRLGTVHIAAALLLGLCSGMVVLWLAVSQPWLGLDLRVQGDAVIAQAASRGPAAELPADARLLRIEANGAAAVMPTPLDLIEEPDTLSTPELLARKAHPSR